MRLAATTDQALLLRWRSHGDPAAFAQLVDRHAAMVHTASMRVVHNRALAQEIAQDSFVQLTQLEQFEGDSLGGWLHRVATNRARDIAKAESRRHTREVAYAESSKGSTVSSESTAILAEIDAALDALPGDLRELIVLHYLEGVTHKDIARRTGVSRPTVTRKLQRALEQLREQLGARGVTATVAAILTTLESARASLAPAALIAALRKLALSNPPTTALVATSAAVFSPSIVALAGTVALLLFLAAVLIPRLLRATDTNDTPPIVVAKPQAVIVDLPTTPQITAAAHQEPVESAPPALAPAPAPLMEKITLHCVDEHGNPIPYAEVFVSKDYVLQPTKLRSEVAYETMRESTKTFIANESGQIELPAFENFPNDVDQSYVAYARVDGRAGAWRLGSNDKKSDQWNEIVLLPSITIEGLVSVPDGGNVQNVSVRLMTLIVRDGKSVVGSVFSNTDKSTETLFDRFATRNPNAQGRFQFDDIPINCSVSLAATAPGLAETQVTRRSQSDTTVLIDMVPESRITGTVRYKPSNAFASNVAVYARPSGLQKNIANTAPFVTFTDEAGRYIFTGLFADTYAISIKYQGDPPAWVAPVVIVVDLDTGEARSSVDLWFESGGWVQGNLIERTSGLPISDAWVCALNPAVGHLREYFACATTDVNGYYKILLPSGASELYLQKLPEGYAYPADQGRQIVTISSIHHDVPAQTSFQVDTSDPYSDPGRALVIGRVVDSTGKPLKNVPVHDVAEGERGVGSERKYLLGRTNDDGRFHFYIQAIQTHRIEIGGSVDYFTGENAQFSKVTKNSFKPVRGKTYDQGEVVVLQYSASLGGSVVDASGQPIKNIEVLLMGVDNDFETSRTLTDTSGKFLFDQIPEGSFRIYIQTNGYKNITLDADAGFEYCIVLELE